jgi:hypothetical protein
VKSFESVEAKKEFCLHLTGVEGVDTEYWIMKDYGSIYWIGEEGNSYRDHTGQGEERIEAYKGGF